MSNFNFTPTDSTTQLKVPFIEDARADFAPYYDVRGKSIEQAKSEVLTEMAKLGAGAVIFSEGYFGPAHVKRYGYSIRFQYGGAHGLIHVAGLPMRTETAAKKKRVQLQALLNVRDWFKAAVTARVFNPDSDALVQYLLVDGERTVAQALHQRGNLPMLTAPSGSWSVK